MDDYKIDSKLTEMEFDIQPVGIKGDKGMRFSYELREMSSDAAIDFEERGQKLIKYYLEDEAEKLKNETDEQLFREAKERIQQKSAEFIAGILFVPQTGENCPPSLIRKFTTWKQRIRILTAQNYLNGVGEKDVSFLLLKGIALDLSQAKDGKIPRNPEQKSSVLGSLPFLKSEDTLEPAAP